ncbi:MAG TPA: SDR family NAD(P)-dependent oxidoreductase [Thermoleophilia bacterium]
MESDRSLAIVTGASSGIGAALAERLAAEGRDVLLVARRRERLEALAARLRAETAAAVDVLVADLTDPQQRLFVEERIAGEERLDLLVNNAGFAGYGPFAEIKPDVAIRLNAVHVAAPLRLTRAALPGMIARGRGAVVNVASLLALSGPLRLPMAGRATYAGAKAFLLTFTQLLAQELEGSGVQAMVCLPGMVESEFHGIGGGRFAGVSLMAAEDVAQAIIVGLELGETVCAPTLEDATVLERLRDVQQEALSAARSTELAARYRRR